MRENGREPTETGPEWERTGYTESSQIRAKNAKTQIKNSPNMTENERENELDNERELKLAYFHFCTLFQQNTGAVSSVQVLSSHSARQSHKSKTGPSSSSAKHFELSFHSLQRMVLRLVGHL